MIREVKSLISFFLIMLIILVLLFLLVDGCGTSNRCNGREITKLYTVEKYKVHETGVEIWATSESGEEKGFFAEHKDIFCYDEEIDDGISRVIILGCSECDFVKDGYLYFSKEDFKEYIKEIYDIE